MRTLDLVNDRGELCELAPETVLAYMLFPDDDRGRQEWFGAFLVVVLSRMGRERPDESARDRAFRRACEAGAARLLLPDRPDDLLQMGDLWSMKRTPREILRAGLERSTNHGVRRPARGFLAADLLYLRLRAEDDGLQRPSLETAIAALAQLQPGLPQRRADDERDRSKTIQRAWSDFKNAAHLWAAWRLQQHVARLNAILPRVRRQATAELKKQFPDHSLAEIEAALPAGPVWGETLTRERRISRLREQLWIAGALLERMRAFPPIKDWQPLELPASLVHSGPLPPLLPLDERERRALVEASLG